MPRIYYERILELAALPELSLSEKDYIYELALENYLQAELELEELLSIRTAFYGEKEVELQREPVEEVTKVESIEAAIQPEPTEEWKEGQGQETKEYCISCGKKLEAMFGMLGSLCPECQRRKRNG